MRQLAVFLFCFIVSVPFALSCTGPADSGDCSPRTIATDASVDGLPFDGPGRRDVCMVVCSFASGSCQRVGPNSVRCTDPCP